MERKFEKKRITVDQAARIMGVAHEFVRIGILQGKLPFGVAIKKHTRWNFYISPKLFWDYVGGDGERDDEKDDEKDAE